MNVLFSSQQYGSEPANTISSVVSTCANKTSKCNGTICISKKHWHEKNKLQICILSLLQDANQIPEASVLEELCKKCEHALTWRIYFYSHLHHISQLKGCRAPESLLTAFLLLTGCLSSTWQNQTTNIMNFLDHRGLTITIKAANN